MLSDRFACAKAKGARLLRTRSRGVCPMCSFLALVACLVVPMGIAWVVYANWGPYCAGAVFLSLLVSVLTPLSAVFVNHHIRMRRIRLILILQNKLSVRGCTSEAGGQAGVSLAADGAQPASPAAPKTAGGAQVGHEGADRSPRGSPSSFEFVASKYMIDLPQSILRLSQRIERRLERGQTARADRLMACMFDRLQDIGCLCVGGNRSLIVSSAPLLFVLIVGFLYVSSGMYFYFSGGCLCEVRVFQVFPQKGAIDLRLALSICFVSAYLHVLKQLAQAVQGFDLTGLGFFQAFRHIFVSVVSLFVIYLGYDILSSGLGNVFNVEDASAASSKIFYLIAFAVGQIPESGFLLIMAGLGRYSAFSGFMSLFKRKDERFVEVTRSTPIDVIDGIDLLTRLRLEDFGIAEVQNLATYNPILLHVESRFGLYQSIDWVAQAQLCTVVGLERFLLLRQFNIRTIFDLERAVLSLKATPEIKRVVASILMVTTEAGKKLQTTGDLQITILKKSEKDPAGGLSAAAGTYVQLSEEMTKGLVQRTRAFFRRPARGGKGESQAHFPHVTAANAALSKGAAGSTSVAGEKYTYLYTYTDNLNSRCGGAAKDYDVFEYESDFASLEHIVMLILDDLHVVRLRQIWEWIDRNLGADARSLDDTRASIYGA